MDRKEFIDILEEKKIEYIDVDGVLTLRHEKNGTIDLGKLTSIANNL